MAYFRQQSMYTGMTVGLPNGHKVSVDFVLEDTKEGYIASENGYVVNQIRTAINAHSGGWEEISEADYHEAVKKKANPAPAKSRGFRKLNAGMFQPNRAGEGAAFAAAAAKKPEPIAVPKPEEMKLPPRPRVGKLVTT